MRIALLSLILLIGGCTTSSMNDPVVVRVFNERITALEKQLEKQVAVTENQKPVAREMVTNAIPRSTNGKLSEGQKDFIFVMMDYLSDKN